MKIKKGDKVIVIAGKDKGKSGEVLRAFPKEYKVLVEGVNIVKKHVKSRGKSDKGGIIEKIMPIHVSNVAIEDPSTKRPTRIRIERDVKTGKATRIAVRSGKEIK